MNSDAISKYDQWNNRLVSYFFLDNSAQKPVYLDMEHELVERLCSEIHGDGDNAERQFTQVISETLKLADSNPFQLHLDRLKRWDSQKQMEDPPFIALLAFFSSVAEEMVSDEKFTASNYYGRLAVKLGVDDDRQKSRLVKGFKKCEKIWQSLNDWLDSWDGYRGLPTAKPLDFRRFVSVAISQALVRDADRKNLKRMFIDFRIAPRQILPPIQMQQILGEWLGSPSNINSALSKLWSRANPDIKKRVTDIAGHELLHWDGSQANERGRNQLVQNLFVRAEFRKNPLPRLELYLIAYGQREVYGGNYVIDSATDETARTALSKCEQIKLKDLGKENILSLEPWRDVQSGDLLLGNLILKNSNNNICVTLKRQPRSIIILVHDELENSYNEIEHIQLLTKHIILCREELSEKVSQHFSKCARPGFLKYTSHSQLRELPERWHAYTDVQIFLQEESSGLERLTPLSSQELKLAGGLRINKSVWQNNFPPVVEFAGPCVEDFTVSLRSNFLPDSGEEVEHRFGPFSQHCSLSLKDQTKILNDGNYEIKILSSDSKAVDSRCFTLKSGNNPRSFDLNTPHLGFSLNQPNKLNPVSPDKTEIPKDDFLIGAWAHQNMSNSITLNSGDSDIPTELFKTGPGENENENEIHSSRLNSVAGSGLTCLTLGYHVWICDPYQQGESRSKLKRQKCRHCRQEVWSWVSRGQRVVTRNRSQRRQRNRISIPRIERTNPGSGISLSNLESINNNDAPDMNALLDSISYLGEGRWDKFRELCSRLNEDNLFPYKAARILSSLGHCEFFLDSKKMRQKDFRMAFPTIVKTSINSWVLSGSRSSKLLEALANRGDETGVKIEEKKLPDQPTIFRFMAAENEMMQEVINGASSDISQKILASLDFSLKAVALSQPISNLVENAYNASVSDRNLERYDISQNKWLSAEQFSEPGAYRIKSFGAVYFFADPNNFFQGNASVLEPRIVKHLEAKRTNRNLVCYNRDEQCLMVAPNCELPSLLDRAATMCSGEYPCQEDAYGRQKYQGVPKAVADGIWSKLMN